MRLVGGATCIRMQRFYRSAWPWSEGFESLLDSLKVGTERPCDFKQMMSVIRIV